MHAADTILFLQHPAIDKQQWDDCVKHSPHALIYAHTFYLDSISPGWQALVAADYSWVLPLTQKKKFTISYLYQPAFTQQLGVFAKAGVNVPYPAIIQKMQQHFKFCEVQWNHQTSIDLPGNVAIKTATNFILDLSVGYESLESNFSKDLLRNIKRAGKFNYKYEPTDEFARCIEMYRKYYGERTPHVTSNDYASFQKICLHAAKQNMIFCRQVKNKNNEILAIALLLFDGKRLYNMMNTTTAAGRKTEANHFLLNNIIEEFSGKAIVFDFEGSDLAGVKNFYENFSPINQPYFMVRYNQLPWPLTLLKQ